MQRRIPLGALIGVALAASLGAAGVMWAVANNNSTAGDTARLIPANAVVYATVNTDATSRQWVQMSQLLSRLGLDDELRRLRDQSADDQNLDFEKDIAPFIGGEAAFALMGESMADPEIIAVLATRDGDRAWQKAIKGLDESAKDSGGKPEVRRYRDTEIRTYPQDSGPSVAIARKDRYLLAATSAELVQKSLDLEAGQGESLADLERYRTARASVAEDPLLFVYVNPKAVVDVISGLVPVAALGGASIEDALNSGDLERAAMGLALSAEDKGLRLEWQMTGLAQNEGSFVSVPAPDVSRFTGRAPADSLLFLWGGQLWGGNNGSLKSAIDSLRQRGGSEQITRQIDDYLQQLNRELGFDIEADLLKQLRGEYAVAAGSRELNTDNVWVAGMATVQDGGKVSRALGKIARYEQKQGRQTATANINGVTVTESRARRGSPVEWAYGVAGDELLAGYGADTVRRTIEHKEPLSDDEDFREAVSTLPKDRTAAVFVNLKRIVEMTRKSGTLSDSVLNADAAARLRYLTVGFTQRKGLSGFVTFLRIAEK